MKKIQEPPKISIFDKSAQNRFSFFNKPASKSMNQTKINTPQFRINQHKGA